MKIPRPTDQRVVRTRAALRNALIASMVEQGWEQTSIQDICREANVGRSTFYTHFADKEDLLLSGLGELRLLLSQPGSASSTFKRPLAFTRGLLEHAHESRRMFRALLGTKSSHVARQGFLDLVIELTREELTTTLGPRAELEATIHYVSGAFFELLTWWLEARRSPSLDEVDRMFRTLTLPVLRAARGA